MELKKPRVLTDLNSSRNNVSMMEPTCNPTHVRSDALRSTLGLSTAATLTVPSTATNSSFTSSSSSSSSSSISSAPFTATLPSSMLAGSHTATATAVSMKVDARDMGRAVRADPASKVGVAHVPGLSGLSGIAGREGSRLGDATKDPDCNQS